MKKIMNIWNNNNGFGEFIAPLAKAIFALTASAVVLGIIYTSLKVIAATTGQDIQNIVP